MHECSVALSCPTLWDPMDWYMGFSRPEYWRGKPFPSPGDLLNPGIKPRSLALQADSLPAEPQSLWYKSKQQVSRPCIPPFHMLTVWGEKPVSLRNTLKEI